MPSRSASIPTSISPHRAGQGGLRPARRRCGGLSRQLQHGHGDIEYQFPILAGTGEGGTLAAATLAQAPGNTLAGVVSIDPSAAVRTARPLCAGQTATPAGEAGFSYGPVDTLNGFWTIGLTPAAPRQGREHAAELHRAGMPLEIKPLDGGDTAAELAALVAPHLARGTAEGVAALPLIELPAAAPSPLMAVVLSGDGGWRDLDKTIADALQQDGVSVVGWDSVRYFWHRKDPDDAAADLAAVLETYLARFHAEKVALVGYSFGADVLPFLYNRLPQNLRDRVGDVAAGLHRPGRLGDHRDGLARLAAKRRCAAGESRARQGAEAAHPVLLRRRGKRQPVSPARGAGHHGVQDHRRPSFRRRLCGARAQDRRRIPQAGRELETGRNPFPAVAWASGSNGHAAVMSLAATAPKTVAAEPASRFDPRSLDALNFLLADVRGALGPYLNVFLVTQQGWSQSEVGLVTTIGGFLGLAAQTPAGALIDATRAKRAVVAVALGMLALGAIAIFAAPRFLPVTIANAVIAVVGDVFGPAVAALTLGLFVRAELARRMGRNAAFDHAGNVAIAGAAAAVGWAFGQRAVFLLVPVFAGLALAALFSIPSSAIDDERARGADDRHGADRGEPVPGRRALATCRPLLVFGGCTLLFHLANAPLLPLVGQKLAAAHPAFATAMMSGCIIAAQIVMLPLAVLVGRTADRWGRRRLLLAGFAILPVRAVLYTVSDDSAWLIAVAAPRRGGSRYPGGADAAGDRRSDARHRAL